jgi:hypothetical protein
MQKSTIIRTNIGAAFIDHSHYMSAVSDSIGKYLFPNLICSRCTIYKWCKFCVFAQVHAASFAVCLLHNLQSENIFTNNSEQAGAAIAKFIFASLLILLFTHQWLSERATLVSRHHARLVPIVSLIKKFFCIMEQLIRILICTQFSLNV